MNRIVITATVFLSFGFSGVISPAYSTTNNDTSRVVKMEICNFVSDNQLISDPSRVMETCCSEQLGYCIMCDPLSGDGCRR
ncbi:MAG: hypothetical protein COB78_08195 [Hyphomicrobiales bacterium]|nr:MAG: hypothetical protein COB78_08195 [Hyphomicrobiales bacterium]